MVKKAQITVFVIIGIVILMVIGMLMYLVNTGTIKEGFVHEVLSVAFREDPMEDYIEDCLEWVTDDSIANIISNGGQSRLKVFRGEPTAALPEGQLFPLYYQFSGLFVPLYYVYDNKTGQNLNLAPNPDQLLAQLEDRITLSMPYCLNGYKAFTDQGMELTMEKRGGRTKAIFLDEEKIKIIYYPDVYGTADDKNFRPGERVYIVESNLKFFYNVVKLLLTQYDDEEMDPNGFPELFLGSLANRYDFKYTKSSLENSKIILSLSKESTIPTYEKDGKYTVFTVALRYDWDERLNPYYDQIDSIDLIDSRVWTLNPEDEPRGYLTPQGFQWDISVYPEFAGYDNFAVYSDNFIVKDNMLVNKPIYPKFKTHKIIVKAMKEGDDSDDHKLGRFEVTIEDPHHDKPFVGVFNETGAFRGYKYYQRMWAVGSQGRSPIYALTLPEELSNMPCGGDLKINDVTGELSGYITAPVGDYPINITVIQTLQDNRITYVQFTPLLKVRGDYEIEGCKGA